MLCYIQGFIVIFMCDFIKYAFSIFKLYTMYLYRLIGILLLLSGYMTRS